MAASEKLEKDKKGSTMICLSQQLWFPELWWEAASGGSGLDTAACPLRPFPLSLPGERLALGAVAPRAGRTSCWLQLRSPHSEGINTVESGHTHNLCGTKRIFHVSCFILSYNKCEELGLSEKHTFQGLRLDSNQGEIHPPVTLPCPWRHVLGVSRCTAL